MTSVDYQPSITAISVLGTASVKQFGAVGDGVTDDTAAIQAAVNTGLPVYLPNGTYLTTTDITLTNVSDVAITFAPNAWIKVSHGGNGIAILNSQRVTVENPHFMLGYVAGQTGLRITNSTRCSVKFPVFWFFVNIASGITCLFVDNNSYWTQVLIPRVRKDSGTLTGTAAKGVYFNNLSNACEVWGGDIAHCDDGVYIQDSNACLVNGTAFEAVTNGVTLAGSGQGAQGTRVIGTRHESSTTALNITTTVSLMNTPIVFDNPTIISNVTTQINNPNSIPLSFKIGAKISLLGMGTNADDSQLTVTADGSQTADLIVAGGRNAFGRVWSVDKNGNNYLKSDGAGLPTHPEPGTTLGFIRFYSTTLRLAAWSSNSTSGTVAIATGDGAGGLQDRINVTATSLAPTQNNALLLGLTGSRWIRSYYVQGPVIGVFATGVRPAASTAAGLMVFDGTLNKPIWSDGTNWRDATGAVV